MYIHNLNPVAISLGPLKIYWYGLVYFLGFLIVYYLLSKNKDKLKLSTNDIDNFLGLMIIYMLIGARLVHVIFWNPAYYFQNPLEILFFWQGGLAFHGGMIGIIAATIQTSIKHKLSFYKLADFLVVPATLALAFGRIANFINAELVGRVTTVSWCVDFGDQLCRHPSQIYGFIARLIAFFILLYIYKTQIKNKYKDGITFYSFVILLGLTRIIVDFFRQDALIFQWTMGQWLSLAMVVIAIRVLAYWHRERKR